MKPALLRYKAREQAAPVPPLPTIFHHLRLVDRAKRRRGGEKKVKRTERRENERTGDDEVLGVRGAAKEECVAERRRERGRRASTSHQPGEPPPSRSRRLVLRDCFSAAATPAHGADLPRLVCAQGWPPHPPHHNRPGLLRSWPPPAQSPRGLRSPCLPASQIDIALYAFFVSLSPVVILRRRTSPLKRTSSCTTLGLRLSPSLVSGRRSSYLKRAIPMRRSRGPTSASAP